MTSILSRLVSTVKSVLLPAAVNSVPDHPHPHPHPSCDRDSDRDAHINHNRNHHAHTHTHTHTHLHSHACTDPSNHTNTNTNTTTIHPQQLTSEPSIDNPTVIPPTKHHRSQHQHQHQHQHLSLPVPTFSPFVATSPPSHSHSHSHSHGCSSSPSPSSSSSSSSLSLPPLPPSDRSLSCHHHSVQFYESDAYLIHSVVDLIETGLRTGDAVIIIATSQHNTSMEQALIKRGVDPHVYQKNQQLYLLDAHQTLAAFARRHEKKDAIPTSIESITASLAHHSTDPVKFGHVIGDLLRRTLTRFPRVRAYGEMVALLMAQKNVSATIELEEYWNGLQATLPFSLLCGYPLAQFRTETIITSTSTATSTATSTSTYTERTELDMPSPSPSPCPSLTPSPCHELSASSSPSPSLMCPTPPPPPAFFHQICACHSFVLPDEQYLKIKDTEHELRQIQYMEYRNKQYDRGSVSGSGSGSGSERSARSSSSSSSNSSLSSSSSPESPITSTPIIPTPTSPWTSTSDNESDNAAVELSSNAVPSSSSSSSSSSATRTRLTRSRTRRRTRIHTPSSRHAEHPHTRAPSTTSSMHPSVPSFTTPSPSLATHSALSCTPSDPSSSISTSTSSTSTSTSTLSRLSRSSNKRRRSSRTSISALSSLSTSSLSPSSSPSPARECESAISPRLSPSPSPPSKRMRLRMRSRMRRSSIPIPNPRHHMRMHEDSAASISRSISKFPQFQGRTILVTEDNLINSKIICAMLRRLGLETIVAWNGSECVRIVAKNQQPIHAILMDLQMPVMNGLDATRAIRALDSSLAQIPIIALTANVLDQDRTACRAAGMSGFIAKPVTIHHLTEQLSHALQVQSGDKDDTIQFDFPQFDQSNIDAAEAGHTDRDRDRSLRRHVSV